MKINEIINENAAAGITKAFNSLGDPVFANLQRVALLAMQGRQSEAAGRLQTVIKGADPAVQKKITDAVNNIKPVTINGRVADSSTLDKSKQHNDWIINTFIPWVQSLLGQQGMAEDASGIDFDMQFDDDTGSFATVTARAHGRVLGSVKFFMDGDHLEADMVEVDERFQGQGIAAAMYDYVKSKGYRIRRSGQQTDAGAGFWGKHRPEQNVWENFADGKGPGRPGDSQRHGIPKGATMAELEKASHSKGRKGQLARWQLNMRRGKKE
jgi:ribosomal protein S18 acetylase RimI-like enzyme